MILASNKHVSISTWFVRGFFVFLIFLTLTNKVYCQTETVISLHDFNKVRSTSTQENEIILGVEAYDFTNNQLEYHSYLVALDANLDEKKIFQNGLNAIEISIPSFSNIRLEKLIIRDNSIWVCGNLLANESQNINNGFVAKLTYTGQLDSSFSNDGYLLLSSEIAFSDQVNDMVIDENNNIYIAGFAINPSEVFDPFPLIMKYDSLGNSVSTFNTSGVKYTQL